MHPPFLRTTTWFSPAFFRKFNRLLKMPHVRYCDLCISQYGDAYYRIENFLEQAPNFHSHNYSVPSHDDAIVPSKLVTDAILADLLNKKISPVIFVLNFGGMYTARRYWVDNEIEFSQMYGKPLIGLAPWGRNRISESVQAAAQEMVG